MPESTPKPTTSATAASGEASNNPVGSSGNNTNNYPNASASQSNNNNTTSGVTNAKEDEVSIENTPRDIKLMSILLQSHGVEDCDKNVVHQLLEFGHRYTVDVLQDAQVYAEHANKHNIDMEDVRLAIQGRVNYSSTSPLDKEFLLDLATERNKQPLPLIPEKYGVRLPPEKHTLTGINFQIVPEKKPQQ
ncbi:Transcription initiation factor TFIID subunit 9 [Mycoemilia scoparia]|uniref:Transcription initiation factor TFIID subunit 9 n=1 Tax=Mycoemilia scoparia TaxID=417184 RepID=A0A9W7ZS96_9FUNG|nr:Transcription initiation factor TFIID subunit 9 [Mycoemilia scoparia]